MPQAFRRIVRMQRQILKTVRADVRRVIGPQSAELRRYYDSYKREFRGPAKSSSKDELLEACREAHIILLGDYHTFDQSQKAALRLLRELVRHDPWLALGLELVPTRHQPALDEYLAGRLSEQAFLERIDYARAWGFCWENFQPLFEFARAHNIQMLALNLENESLATRDEHAARLIARFSATQPKRKVFVLYGDLHLARGHLPRRLKSELRGHRARRQLVTIFQNSETLYWRLADGGAAHDVDVLDLGSGRYCIMNAPPWVKLQSYLEWAEMSGPLASRTADDDATSPNLHEMALDRLRHLADTLELALPAGIDFSIQTADDLSFLGKRTGSLAGLSRDELKTVKYHVLGNRSLFVPGPKIVYLASSSVNALSETVSIALHASASGSPLLHHDPKRHFFAAVLTQTIGYFGSKVLNHKRKCDLEEDYARLAALKGGRGLLPQERMQRRVARIVLRHCEAQREWLRAGRYQAPLTVRGPAQVPIFLESARALGSILGEKLYASFVAGRYPRLKLEKLFRSKLDNPRTSRALYLRLVSELETARLPHSSKLDLL